MPRKPSRKTLVRNLDNAVSRYIRDRDGCCVLCGTTSPLDNGHLFTRKNYSTRWDISDDGNCHALCKKCNFRDSHDTYYYRRWFRETFSIERYDELHLQFSTFRKFKNFELEELLEEIKNVNTQRT